MHYSFCRHFRFVLASMALFFLAGAGKLSWGQAADATSSFSETVSRAIGAKCVSCHRPDNLKGGLNLTTREGWLTGGELGPALVPGVPAESSVYTRAIPHADTPPEMPEKGEPLTPDEATALRDWIAADAPWPEGLVIREASKADRSFWSFQPIAIVNPPAANNISAEWRGNLIDRFVWTKLHEQHLEPNPPAEPLTFLRRITYDVTGLAPTPEEMAWWLETCRTTAETEGSPIALTDSAVEQLVDRLLASPRYGEHWGRHWLDVIRFGESRGFERNEIITNLWPFRDYVIRSFNEDKPFDQFIVEHLAGDVVGAHQPEVEIGSAFLVAGPYDDVGNQDATAAARIRADQMDEMIRATAEGFLGLTIGCARCHDHKFDPILTADYYGMYATFAGTVHGPREVSTEAARLEREQRLAPLVKRQTDLSTARTMLEMDLANRAEQQAAAATLSWTRPPASRYGTEETFPPNAAKFVKLTVEGSDGPGGNPGQFRLDEFEVWSSETNSRNVALAANGGQATGASRSAKDFSGAYGVDLVIDGKFGQRWQAAGKELLVEFAKVETIDRVYFSSDRNRALGTDYSLTTFVGEYRIEISVDGQTWQEVASSSTRQPATDHLRLQRLLKLVTTPADSDQRKELSRELAEVNAEIAKVPALPTWWVGTHRAAPGPFHIFVGGDPQRRGSEVLPASPNVLNDRESAYQLSADSSESERRLALARWMTAPDQPLAPRVLANRIWHYHFGTGIVDTPSDFGYLGGRPSHPELLDWLARELLGNGWRLKPLHRQILTSQTYRQSSGWREAAGRVDADSRLLWRFPPRRLAAEEIRDTLLQLAGVLNLEMGGPGFRLYEYQQDNVATYVPLDVHGPETYRRAVYHHTARASRVDLMSEFDCPDPAFSEPRRASTITPLQALTLMNHAFSVDMADQFATRLKAVSPATVEQVETAFQLAFARSATPAEASAASELVSSFGLRSFCRALLNSNELIYLK